MFRWTPLCAQAAAVDDTTQFRRLFRLGYCYGGSLLAVATRADDESDTPLPLTAYFCCKWHSNCCKPGTFLIKVLCAQAAAVDDTTQFRRLFRLGDGGSLLAVATRSDDESDTLVTLTADSQTPVVLHWGTGTVKERGWGLPTEAVVPQGSKKHSGGAPPGCHFNETNSKPLSVAHDVTALAEQRAQGLRRTSQLCGGQGWRACTSGAALLISLWCAWGLRSTAEVRHLVAFLFARELTVLAEQRRASDQVPNMYSRNGRGCVRAGQAYETPFADCSKKDSECDPLTAEARVPLQQLHLSFPAAADVAQLHFVLRSEDATQWFKDGNSNFAVPVAPRREDDDAAGAVDSALVQVRFWCFAQRFKFIYLFFKRN